MAPPTSGPRRGRRTPVSRAAVLRTAVEVADRDGVGAVTMRGIARRLGVEAMSLYHHVANKEQILDGMVDAVFAEIELPADGDWADAMRRRAGSARDALVRHPWAIGLMDSRANPGPATLTHHDAVLGCLRGGGFSVAGAAHAFAVLDSYVYGFALQEVSLPFEAEGEIEEVAAGIRSGFPEGAYPHIEEIMVEHALQPGYAFADEFEFGLDLVLDGLERIRRR